MSMGDRLAWCVTMILCVSCPLRAAALSDVDGTAQHKNWQIRNLYGKELTAARQARDSADALFEEYKRLYPCPVVKSAEESRDFKRVMAAYGEAIKQYEGTDIGAYCQLRRCEPYKYRGEFRRAIEQAQTAAADYAGTAYETRAYFAIATLYLQGLHDPQGAIPWFERIPQPSSTDPERVVGPQEYNEDHKLYLSAQQQIAKCEIALGRGIGAQERYARLSTSYPQFKEHFSDVLRFEQESDLYNRFGVDDAHLLDYVMESYPSRSVPAPGPSEAVHEDRPPALPAEVNTCPGERAGGVDKKVVNTNLVRPDHSTTARPLFAAWGIVLIPLIGMLSGVGLLIYRVKARKEGGAMDG